MAGIPKNGRSFVDVSPFPRGYVQVNHRSFSGCSHVERLAMFFNVDLLISCLASTLKLTLVNSVHSGGGFHC